MSRLPSGSVIARQRSRRVTLARYEREWRKGRFVWLPPARSVFDVIREVLDEDTVQRLRTPLRDDDYIFLAHG